MGFDSDRTNRFSRREGLSERSVWQCAAAMAGGTLGLTRSTQQPADGYPRPTTASLHPSLDDFSEVSSRVHLHHSACRGSQHEQYRDGTHRQS